MAKKKREPQTIGYLLGALAQVALGGYWSWGGLARLQETGAGTPTAAAGLLLLAVGAPIFLLGLRAVSRYRRSRQNRARADI